MKIYIYSYIYIKIKKSHVTINLEFISLFWRYHDIFTWNFGSVCITTCCNLLYFKNTYISFAIILCIIIRKNWSQFLYTRFKLWLSTISQATTNCIIAPQFSDTQRLPPVEKQFCIIHSITQQFPGNLKYLCVLCATNL